MADSGARHEFTQAVRAPSGEEWVRRQPLPWLLGPAFVASVAYVDPGNVAANLTAGAQYGYLLVWVLVAAMALAATSTHTSRYPYWAPAVRLAATLPGSCLLYTSPSPRD